MYNFIAKLLIKMLPRLSKDTRTYVMSKLLDNIGALPIRKMISFSPDGTIIINGNQLSLEQSISFRGSVENLRDNEARKIFHNQIKFLAIELGTFQGLTPEMIQFSKAALWIQGEEDKLIESIIGMKE